MIANRRLTLLAGTIGIGSVLNACDLGGNKPKFNHTDITGADFGRTLELTDSSGKRCKLADFNGKLVIVFFGFTQCPDICPTTLLETSKALKTLGADSDRVQVVFVTLDPERDTPAVLSKYVPAFDSRFIGLYGNLDETKKAAREFKVFFEKVPGQTPGTYTIDHTAASYVFDTQGRIRLFIKHGQPTEWLAADLKTLLAQS